MDRTVALQNDLPDADNEAEMNIWKDIVVPQRDTEPARLPLDMELDVGIYEVKDALGVFFSSNLGPAMLLRPKPKQVRNPGGTGVPPRKRPRHPTHGVG